jgi:hypothetical protein
MPIINNDGVRGARESLYKSVEGTRLEELSPLSKEMLPPEIAPLASEQTLRLVTGRTRRNGYFESPEQQSTSPNRVPHYNQVRQFLTKIDVNDLVRAYEHMGRVDQQSSDYLRAALDRIIALREFLSQRYERDVSEIKREMRSASQEG